MAKQAKSRGDGAVIDGAAEEVKPAKKRTGPAQFAQQVMAEGRKVTWTTWRETYISTLMVLGMVAVTAVFFLAIDSVLRLGVALLLSVNQ